MWRRQLTWALGVALALWLGACGGDSRRSRPGPDDDGGSAADGGRDSGGGGVDAGGGSRDGGGGGGGDDCAERARWIYLIDSDSTLVRFEPDSLTFTPMGTLDCPSGGNSPFSMSVDRDAQAWVLHQDGRIYDVSTADASCTSTSFAPDQEGFELFGMGFASDGPDTDAETLFVAGGAELSIGTGSASLGSIDASTLALTRVGDLPGWPELTGTGEGELWGFFPDTSPPSIRRIDKASGATPTTYDLTELGSVSASAWAFAFWGGSFWMFYKSQSDSSTNVFRLNKSTGQTKEVLHNTGRYIVGAGVSTCAPLHYLWAKAVST